MLMESTTDYIIHFLIMTSLKYKITPVDLCRRFSQYSCALCCGSVCSSWFNQENQINFLVFCLFKNYSHEGFSKKNIDYINSFRNNVYLSKSTFNLFKSTGFVHQRVEHFRTIHSAHTVFICFVFISEQTATSALYNINWLVFITEMKSVYSAVRSGL